jgi:hypothetical protein
MALGGTFTRMVSGSLNAPRKRGWGKDAKARAGVDYGGIQFHGHRQSSQTRVYEITTQKLPGRLVVRAKLRWEYKACACHTDRNRGMPNLIHTWRN